MQLKKVDIALNIEREKNILLSLLYDIKKVCGSETYNSHSAFKRDDDTC